MGDTTVSTITSILRDTPRPITELNHELPRDLAKIVRHCLVKDAEHRYQSAKDLRNDLEDVKHDVDSGEVLAPAAIRDVRPPRWWPSALAIVGAMAVLGLMLWLRFGLFRTEPSAPPAISVPLTGNAGREEHPALSPDGKQVAYAWNGGAGDNFNIYVKLLGAGAPLRLTNHPGIDVSPAWSPDGRYIAFLRRSLRADGIFVIPALGGPERKMGESFGISSFWISGVRAILPSGSGISSL